MKFEPSEEALYGKKKVDPEAKARLENITRIVAIIVAFLSTFGLFVKILFF